MKAVVGTRGAAVVSGGLFAVMLSAGTADAQVRGNAAYRASFTAACPSATGPLIALCVASRQGQISSDSSSSLTPNQTLAASGSSLDRAEALAASTEARLESLRQGGGTEKSGERAGRFNLFANAQGEWSDQDRVDFANERGFDGDATRLTIGADMQFAPAVTLGASITYGDYSSDFDPNPSGTAFTPQADAGSVNAQDFTFAVFGSLALSTDTWMDASVGIGFTEYDFRRNATFQESNRAVPQTNIQARGDSDGREYHASLGAGWDYDGGKLSLGPYARIRYLHSTVDGYLERETTATGLTLAVSKSRATSFTSVIGGRASYAISTSWGVVVPQARFEYEHEFEDDPRAVTTRLALSSNGPAFSITPDAPDRNYFNLGAGLVLVLPDGWMSFLDYDALVGYSDFERQRVTVGVRRAF